MRLPGGALAETIGFVPAVIYIVAKTLIAIGLWVAAVIGWLTVPLAWWQRLLVIVAAATLVAAMPITDEIGFALVALFAASWWLRTRNARQTA